MAEILYNQLAVLAADPPTTDYAIIYKAAGRTAPGTPDATANAAAASNPPAYITLENLIAFVQPPAADAATQGIVELATNVEAVAGSDTTRAVTPAGVAAAIAAGLERGSGGGQAETGESIVAKLAALTEDNRLSYLSLRDVPSTITTFLGLSDTPSTFGLAGNLVRINSAANALEFVAPPAAETGATIVNKISLLTGNARLSYNSLRDLPSRSNSFTSLQDTPSRLGSEGQVVVVGDFLSAGLAFQDYAFTALSDTPSSLGTAGQIPAVNSAANALEWIDAPSGGASPAWRSIWPFVGGDIITGTTTRRDNSRILRENVAGKDVLVKSTVHTSAAGTRYTFIPGVDITISTGSTPNYDLGTGTLRCNFRILAQGENPSIFAFNAFNNQRITNVFVRG